ncbi:hypothetical protein [Flavobacterium soyangense]|uniref:Uncharacterized protein n=1 Tax=Flavobacterium soyangense TaxID=2023265 RepID=A0A930XUV8_9FLAO|nr:hypothetical protein [Flavobacterium soyangense]MBF2707432.1 hypothetical protein [Flavobacterium soyangense]
MKNTQLEKYQIDFVKIKVNIDSSTTIRKDRLVEHPALRNQYSLNPILGDYVKNFSLYFCNDNSVVIKSSIPYFLYGHNYKEIREGQLSKFAEIIEGLLGIDVTKGVVKEFEFGGYEKIEIRSDSYLKSIFGMCGFQLEKSTSFMKMYGNQSSAIHYKVYDAIANAKVKKTFEVAKFPKSTVIKHEIKFLNPKKYFGEDILFFDLSNNFHFGKNIMDCLHNLLHDFKGKIIFKNEIIYKPIKDDLINILYATVKNLEKKNSIMVYEELMDLINTLGLTASQKSKRKKSIELLEEAYNREFNIF